MLNLNNYICVLDLGSSKIAGCLAQVKAKGISNIYLSCLPAKGIKNGVIINSVELTDSVNKVIKDLRAKSAVNIRYIYANISGSQIVTKHSHAIVPLAERGSKVITPQDIQRVNEQARILGSSLEEEIIHVIPSSYAIDAKDNIANPVGLYSHKLEVDLYLICAKLSSLEALSRAINQSGYEIRDLFFSGLATSGIVYGGQDKEGLNLFCDIGSDITELLLFSNGGLYNLEIMPLGGDMLTVGLEEELKIPFELAEEIKKSYGIIGEHADMQEDKEILVKKSNLYKPIKQKLVAEIITSAAKSIFSSLKDTLEKKVPLHKISSVTVTGRTAMLEGFIETLENTLSIPVKFGRIRNAEIASLAGANSELAGQKYLTYLTCLGLLNEALKQKREKAISFAATSNNPLVKAVTRVREIYQEYF